MSASGRSVVTRRRFFRLATGGIGGMILAGLGAGCTPEEAGWLSLLQDYETCTRANIVTVNGRRALLSARLYPGTYVRDAVFWGPLGLADPALGYECYQWFAESQFASGQIPTAVPLTLEESDRLVPQDDEGTLLFIIASDWLQQAGYPVDLAQVERAYQWVMTHVQADAYISPPGAFRYWADTVQLDTADVISHNQGLLCLARQALVNLGSAAVTATDVTSAVAVFRSFYDAEQAYIRFGRDSNFAYAQDVSTLLPEFISRYLYDSALLPDEIVVAHVDHIVDSAAVYDADGSLVGLKVISGASGDYMLPEWYHAPELNQPGLYQNGGHWPMYSAVALALAYRITGEARYAAMIGQLVQNELAADHLSKEVIRLAYTELGNFDPARTSYTWNILIRTACRWCGLAS
jgi:hypothetical protein